MNLLFILLIAPLVSLMLSFCLLNQNEKMIYKVSVIGISINFVTLIIVFFFWMVDGFQPTLLEGPLLYRSSIDEFSLQLFLDGYGYIYLLVATFLTVIIISFSKFYMHRERGFKRFFNGVTFFYFGLMMVLLSGNLITLFIGWEILGITSFFLISFYRERYLPVKNALKVVSLYRVADVALLLGIWLCHHYFGFNFNFRDLNVLADSHEHILNESIYRFMIPITFLVAAMVKSAQFPFSSWLPRAMEGPTTSSSIFYGSLSVHIGVFLLIRTAPFWEGNFIFHLLIGAIGLITALLSNLTAKVQSTIKTQIAYSSISQIGLMFMEVSLGLYWVAIIHFVCNALLRSYQLLISPSVLSYKIHDQIFHFNPPPTQKTNGLWNKLKLSLYVLSIKEFNLDSFMYEFMWLPIKKAGMLFNFLSHKATYWVAIPLFGLGLYGVYHQEVIPVNLRGFLPEFFGLFGLLLILKAFVSRKSVMFSWIMIVLNKLFQSLAFGYNEHFDFNQVHLYLSGILIAGFIGYWVIARLSKTSKSTSLNEFNGNIYEHPRLGIVFIAACLALVGFPITPTFIGEDLMLGHIHENQILLIGIISLNLIVDGLVIFRNYARLFLGQHISGYHDFAYRSS
jgi:NADH-quinone oxidoreductase subunit L